MTFLEGTTSDHLILARNPHASREQRERSFFTAIALLIAVTVVAGFATWALRGKVAFPAPPLVHVHGVVFMSWVALFVAQTTLIRQGSVATHRRLGWIAVFVAMLICILGPVTAVEAIATHRVPPFFPNNIFLAMNILNIVCFAPLIIAAIALRRRTDWHRRLMLASMLAIMGPGVARITVSLGFGPRAGLAATAILLVYAAIAVIGDLRIRNRIHPAYALAVLAILVEGFGPGPLGTTQMFTDLAKSIATP